MSQIVRHCLNTLTVLEASCFPAARIQDDGPSCQSNVAKCQDKGCENDYFPFITARDKRMLCHKKRLITSHKRAGLRCTIPCQRLSSTRWTISTISNRCWKHFTRSSLSKNVLITQRKYACQIRAISLKCLKFHSGDNYGLGWGPCLIMSRATSTCFVQVTNTAVLRFTITVVSRARHPDPPTALFRKRDHILFSG